METLQRQSLIRPEHSLYPFQEEAVARAYWQSTEADDRALLVVYDMGTGKSPISIYTAAMMVEDGMLDHILVVAEANKVEDWSGVDFPKFSTLDVGKYEGTPTKRQKILDEGPPQVMVMTYELGRQDLVRWKKAKSTAIQGPGPLSTYLEGKRVLIIFDECTKIKTGNTRLTVAWDYLINRRLRKDPTAQVAVLGLTGTPVEKSPEDHFRICRLLAPRLSQTVEEFKRDHVDAYDLYGNATRFKNLSPSNAQPGVVPLSERFSSIIIRKRKTDPDVMENFPSKIDNPPRFIPLLPRQRDFYEQLRETLMDVAMEENPDRPDPSVITILRQVAIAPEALLRSKGKMAQEVVRIIGEKGLRDLGSAKFEEMSRWLSEIGDQQGVVFTFFGQSVLPLAHERIRRAGISVVVNHGQMNPADRQRSQDAFRAGDAQIFLSSDAGARGLNLGVGSALLHLELPVTYAKYVQRSDRIHRVDSQHPSVTIDSLVARGTVEETMATTVLDRHAWAEEVVDGKVIDGEEAEDQGIVSASMMRMMWAEERRRRRSR